MFITSGPVVEDNGSFKTFFSFYQWETLFNLKCTELDVKTLHVQRQSLKSTVFSWFENKLNNIDLPNKTDLDFCRTCFSKVDICVRFSVRQSVRRSVHNLRRP